MFRCLREDGLGILHAWGGGGEGSMCVHVFQHPLGFRVPNIRDPRLGVPVIRVIMHGSLYWGLIYGSFSLNPKPSSLLNPQPLAL